MNYKFWKRIHEYALKKMRNKWNSQDLRCPHCNTWVSEVGKFEYKRDSKTGIDMMTCYQCGKDSYWRRLRTLTESEINAIRESIETSTGHKGDQ